MKTLFPLDVVHAVKSQVKEATTSLVSHLKGASIDLEAVRKCLDRGADLEAAGRVLTASASPVRHTTVLHEVLWMDWQAPLPVYRELLPLLLEYVDEPDALADDPDRSANASSKVSALMFAVKIDQRWAVEQLLAAGADGNLSVKNRTPLSIALGMGHDEGVDLLLAYGVDPHRSRVVGLRSDYLFCARTERAVDALVAAGVDVRAQKSEAWATDELMLQRGRLEERSPQFPDRSDGDARSAGTLAALIKAGCPVSEKALVFAAKFSLERCLEVLDEQGLDWFAPTKTASGLPGANALEMLCQTNLELGRRWEELLDARSKANQLDRCLEPGKKPARACRM